MSTNEIKSSARRPVKRREIFAWSMYDWANSAYSTYQITILMLYLQQVVLPGPPGQLAYAYGIGISTFFAALIAPVLGAVADAHASKRFWLSVCTLAGAGASVAMFFLPVEMSWIFVGLFFTTTLAFELAWGLYCAFLPEIADEKSMNRVSAYGFAMGYVGGGLALLVGVLVVQYGDRLGLPSNLEGDCVVGHEIDFAVGVPPGDYDVTVWLGDLRAARGPVEVLLNGKREESQRTSAGEVLSVMHKVAVPAGELLLQLKGPGQDEQASLAGVRIEGAALAHPLLFDFGTPDSGAETGSIWVTPKDTFKNYDREALAAKSKAIPAAELPENLAFGLRPIEGDKVEGRDAIMIPRLKLGLLIMGLWWGAFSLPTLLLLRDRVQPRAGSESLVETAKRAVGEVAGTLKGVRHYRVLFLFLIAYLIYNDGVATIITQATVFAKEVLHIGAGELVFVVLMIQFVSMPGALFVGWLSGKLGEKQTLMGCIVVYIGWLVAAFFITTRLHFWIMGAVLALVMGGIQSVSRAIMGLMTPAKRSGEFFGFFNLSSKATSFAGPILFGSILAWTGRPHLAILSLLVFFFVGGGLASMVDVTEGRRRAMADE
ncbi:MAG TPA: MFS transporter [Pirellulales bacterium]|nr:MFS transporter [Pirellulales bacterium]